jgi:large subunit ribosomal protein L11
MGKKISAIIKLALSAGKAVPAPPVGPALSQHGVNIASFCKEYNARTIDKLGSIIPVEISVFEDRSYTFILKTPPASFLLINVANIKKGSSEPTKKIVASITKEQVTEIAKIKLPDLNTIYLQSAIKIIIGTAKNMGISILDEV